MSLSFTIPLSIPQMLFDFTVLLFLIQNHTMKKLVLNLSISLQSLSFSIIFLKYNFWSLHFAPTVKVMNFYKPLHRL